jgi:hypothetical protein
MVIRTNRRLLELALDALEKRKAALDAEITDIQAELGRKTLNTKVTPMKMAGTSQWTPARRKIHSFKMKKAWAKKKAANQ